MNTRQKMRGLMSKTMTNYNFAVLTPGRWIGEDSVIL